jgi:NhaP-type Na+/H+ or K+/H+ antiporter
MSAGLAVLSLLIVLYGLVAVKLGRLSVSMPMLFVAFGFLLGPSGTNLLPLSLQAETVKDLTEVALALVLFTDASTLSLQQVHKDARLLLRLLAIGLPLTVILGTAIATGLLSGEGIAFAALLGAILAPTDAELGLPIFTNPQVPVRIRGALNMESGLNDGIVTPIVALCLAVAAATEQYASRGDWLSTAVLAIALAVVIGVAVGAVGGWLLTQTKDRGWTSGQPERIAILGLGLTAYFGAVALHGNGFIAAFIAGIIFAAVSHNWFAEPTEFTETISTVLSLLVWVIFGAILIPIAFRYTTDWRPIAYAVLSLTVVRMLAVAIALIGTHLRLDTVALMGWFGPRGLASVVFTMLAYTQLEAAGRPIDVLMTVATWTILLSVLAHGLSAQPLSAWYARRLRMASDQSVEFLDVPT